MVGNPVCLVNRTSSPVEFVADSRHYVLKPGDNYGFLEGHVRFAMQQNPLMGSEDYYTLEFQSLVGAKDADGKVIEGCPVDAFTDEQLIAALDEIERFNREASGVRMGTKVKPRWAPPRGRAVASLAGENSFASGR